MKTRQSVQSVAAIVLSILFAVGMCMPAFVLCSAEGTGETTVKPSNCEFEVTVGYKESKTYEFEVQNVPEGATVRVFCNDEDRGEGTYITIEKPTEDFTVEAKVVAGDGTTIAASGVVRVTVRNGFFDRLGDFFQSTFGRAADAVLDIVGAVFMRIWIFLHGQ